MHPSYATFYQCSLHVCSHPPTAALSSAVHVDLALTRVSDTGLMALAARSPLLVRLVLSPCDSYNLWGTGRWTAEGLEAFRRLRPEVVVVTVEC